MPRESVRCYADLFGRPPEALLGTRWMDLLPSDEAARVAQFLPQLFKTRKKTEYSHYIVLHSGERRLIYWIDCPILNAEGQLVEYQSTGRDITVPEQQRLALMDSERRYRTIVENIPVGVALVDQHRLRDTRPIPVGVALVDQHRLRDTRPIPVGAKILVASNQDLEALLEKGLFREDLFYRLCETVIKLSPLRQRPEDIPLLTALFLEQARQPDQTRGHQLSPRCLERLSQYHWPGNVRELRNLIHALVETTRAPTIRPTDLPDRLVYDEESSARLKKRMQQVLQDALKRAAGKKAQAARILGVMPRTFTALLERYELKNE